MAEADFKGKSPGYLVKLTAEGGLYVHLSGQSPPLHQHMGLTCRSIYWLESAGVGNLVSHAELTEYCSQVFRPCYVAVMVEHQRDLKWASYSHCQT